MNCVVTFPGTRRQRSLTVLPLLILSTLFSAPVFGATLTSGNSSITINPASDQLATAWMIDGQLQMALQGFYFRVGGVGGEASISTLSLISQTQTTPGSLTVTYGNGLFNIETIYSLVGGAAGSGNADLSEQIRITNLTGNALDFHFFQYTDFDLGAASPGDTVQLGQNLQGLYNEALQTKGNVIYSDTILTPGANHGEVGTFPSTLNGLNDSNPTTLSDNAGPLNSSDATWAFQWDRVIAGGSTFIIGLDKNVYVIPIPEPSVGTLIPVGLGLIAAARRLRQRR
jgi:hypothetical protein